MLEFKSTFLHSRVQKPVRFLERVFGPLAFADVATHSHHPSVTIRFVVNDLSMGFYPPRGSIRSGLAELDVVLAVALKGSLNGVLDPLTGFPVEPIQTPFEGPVEGSGGLSEDAFHVLRPVDCSAGDIPLPSTEISRLQAEAHSLLAFAKRLFDLLDLGDVACDLGCAYDLAGRILDWRDGQRYQQPLSSFCDSNRLEMLNA